MLAPLYCAASPLYFYFFFFNDTATTEIYTLSLHDALPIFVEVQDGDQDPGHGGEDDQADLELQPTHVRAGSHVGLSSSIVGATTRMPPSLSGKHPGVARTSSGLRNVRMRGSSAVFSLSTVPSKSVSPRWTMISRSATR